MTSAALDEQMPWQHPDPVRDAEIQADLARIRAGKAADHTFAQEYCRRAIDHARTHAPLADVA